MTRPAKRSGPLTRPATLLRAMRVHHWTKNLLVFVPPVMAHTLDIPSLTRSGLAFLAFSLVASGSYLLNDLLDREADRRHPVKRNRPLASGALSPSVGMLLIPLALGAGVGAGYSLGGKFLAALLAYIAVAVAYSLWAKKIALADVVILAGLYTLRIIAGAFSVDVPLSPWLLSFSMFFFLNLAFVKRYAELRLLAEGAVDKAEGRGYSRRDLDPLGRLGCASGYLSVLVLALYINGREVASLYSRPYMLWLICPFLLYWVGRMWLLAGRGEMPDDPLDFAFKDKVSYLVGFVTAALLLLAT